MAHLSLLCLGPFQVALDGRPVTGFKSNKVRALLAYLAVEADRPHRRELLAELLWPNRPDRNALSNLRYTLSDLRRIIGDRTASPPFLRITRETLQFNTSSDHWLDVEAFTELTGLRDLRGMEKAIAFYRGSFLEGFSVRASAAFEEWILLKRQQNAQQMLSALRNLVTGCEQRGEYELAQSFARRQVELEPWHEEGHQLLMRVLALDGQRSAALAQYKTCCRLLAAELGVEPAEQTTELYIQIRDGTLIAPTSSVRSPIVVAEAPAFPDQKLVEEERPIFVARERELTSLDGYLHHALAGRGRVVFVTGEPGSGKTALVQEFTRRAQTAHADLIVAGGNCNAYTGVGDPYLPFREILELLTGDVEARLAAGAITREHARRLWHSLPLAAKALVEAGPDLIDTFLPRAALLERAIAQAPTKADWLTRLGDLVKRRPIEPAVPGPQQSDLFEQYARVLHVLARQLPLVLLVDDLQWADLGSISLLFHLGRQLAGSRILIVGAYRAEEVALGRDGERHPLEPVVNEFQREFGDIRVNVDEAASQDFVEAFLDSEPNRLGPSFRELLYQHTRGHPLFTVELLRGLQERGDLVRDPEGRWIEGPALDWDTMPVRVEAVIAERIGRLAQPLRAALRVASVEGEDFTAEVMARVLGIDERKMVERLSSELDRRHRLVRAQAIERLNSRRVSRYRFRNYLFQKYLYDSLDEVERAYLHEDVGNALEELHGDQAGEIAVQLARHFEAAKVTEKAIDYLRQAGERAVYVSAYREGIAHVTKGLALLAELPDSKERGQLELGLQLALGMASTGPMAYGPEVEKAYTRARELCLQLGKKSQLCRVVGELSVSHYVRAEYQKARELGEEGLNLAQQANDPLLVGLGHWHLGFILFSLGEYTAALDHMEQLIDLYSPERHHGSFVFLRGSDPGPSAQSYRACCLWCLGYPEEASRQSQGALALAREFDHPFTMVDVLCFAGCMFNSMRRDAEALKENADELVRVSNIKGFPGWLATGTCYQGEAVAMLGQVSEGIALLHEGIAAMESMGGLLYLPGVLRGLAEALVKAGHADEAMTTVSEALALVGETDERHWEAELHRLRGELLFMQAEFPGAEASLQKAIEVARSQGAKSWELRATTALARLWRKQDRGDQAGQLLGQIYYWFGEGFDTPDLQEARALLSLLS